MNSQNIGVLYEGHLPVHHTGIDHVYKYPGQMDTVLLLKLPHHILNCKTKRVSAGKLL